MTHKKEQIWSNITNAPAYNLQYIQSDKPVRTVLYVLINIYVLGTP